MWRSGLAVALVLLGSLGAALQHPFRAGVSLVRFPVVVRGKDGRLVRGLRASDFEVREDGAPQTIGLFVEGGAEPAPPLHLGVLLDTSESMDRDLDDAETAVIRFIQAVPRARDVTFVSFDSEIRIARFEPDSYTQLFERVRARRAEGATALYDAIGAYLERASADEGEKVMLVYSDGGDTTSSASFGGLQTMLKLSDVLVYAIGYEAAPTDTTAILQGMHLSAIAATTGGEAFFPQSAKELPDIYKRIVEEIDARYLVGYVSTNRAADGRWRKVEIRVTRPGLDAVKVRARPGYFGPRQ